MFGYRRISWQIRAEVDAAKQDLLYILRTEQRPDITLRFPFQKLPPEICNAIYHLHLVQAEDQTQLRRWDDGFSARARAVRYHLDDIPPPFEYTALLILGVSHQVHEEALSIFYHYNTLQLRCVTDLLDFLSSIGPRRRAFVCDVKFLYSGIGSPAAFKLLATCENLTKLHIEVNIGTLFLSHRKKNLLSAWGVSHLLKIRGLETVEISQNGPMSESHKEGLEEAVRNALLQPRKAINSKKRATNPKQASRGKKVAARTKRTIGDGEAQKAKKTKLVHDGNQVVNQLGGDERDT